MKLKGSKAGCQSIRLEGRICLWKLVITSRLFNNILDLNNDYKKIYSENIMDIRIKRLPNESRFLLLSYSELSFSRHYSFIDSQESWIYLQLVETWNWLISNCLTICIHLYTKQDKFDLSTQLKMLDTCQDRHFYFKKEFRETRIDLHEQLFLTFCCCCYDIRKESQYLIKDCFGIYPICFQ